MDLLKILGRKRQQLEEVEARAVILRDEVTTLERALEIAEHERDGSSPALAVEAAPRAPKVLEPTEEAKPKATGKLIEAIRKITRTLPEPISTAAVRESLRQNEPAIYETTHYSSISGTMRRMSMKGELMPVEKGGPGKEATYRRLTPEEKQLEEDVKHAFD